jgi:OOP family OmpA-OmpF porin
MGEPLAKPAEPADAASRPPRATDDLEEVRRVIVGPERRQLRALTARLDDRAARTREIGQVLPDALAMRAGDPQLTRALAPSFEETITASVRRNPQPLADALFPVMGPAIRKAIAHTLNAMVESLNRTVDQSLSLRALQWRFTAWRTGRSFAEVALLNTLVYRVEQVFLIHRESGLLVQHVALPDAPAQDADMISGMLTAIRDFTRDSFGASGDEALDAFRVGETAVLVEQGPHAILAAVVRGTPSPGLRTRLQEALESVHLQRGAELEAYDGDSAPFQSVRPVLDECLQTELKPGARSTSWRRWAFAAALVLIALAAWGALRWRDRARFDDYVARLASQPGIIVIESGRRAGKFYVRGLRDPLAADPSALVSGAGLAADRVEQLWEAYSSHERELAIARARAILRWPDSVQVDSRDGILVASGSADSAWIVEAQRLAPLVPGVSALDASSVVDTTLEAIVAGIESTSLTFPKGRAELTPGQSSLVDGLRAGLSSLDSIGRASGVQFRVEIVGHTDSDGAEDQNVPLSRRRADVVRTLVDAARLGSVDVVTSGAGSHAPLARGGTEEEKRQNRRVAFRVVPRDVHTGRTSISRSPS